MTLLRQLRAEHRYVGTPWPELLRRRTWRWERRPATTGAPAWSR
jgi:hypothetical protein